MSTLFSYSLLVHVPGVLESSFWPLHQKNGNPEGTGSFFFTPPCDFLSPFFLFASFSWFRINRRDDLLLLLGPPSDPPFLRCSWLGNIYRWDRPVGPLPSPSTTVPAAPLLSNSTLSSPGKCPSLLSDFSPFGEAVLLTAVLLTRNEADTSPL